MQQKSGGVFAARIFALASAVNPLAFGHMTGEARQDFAFAFLSILFEGAPFILLGTLISGFIDIYMPPGMMDRFLPRNKTLAVVMAGLLGAIFPVCECAVVPVIRRLVRKGLPVSCALTYMLAAPIVNPITALSTWKAFTGPVMMVHGESMAAHSVMTASRLGLGFAVAVLLGLVVARLPLVWILRKRLVEEIQTKPEAGTEHSHDHCCGHDHEHETDEKHSCCGHDHAPVVEGNPRLVAAFRSALKDFVDVGVYFSIGVAITALFNTGIAPGAAWLDTLANRQILAPSALMVLAFILSLCSTSDAFIAATLDKFTYGAKLAFLVFGPMLDLKLLFLYQTVLRRKFIVGMAIGLFVVIGASAFYFQWYLNSQSALP
ncbi:MAG: hypothetical protein RI957_964 [Verrucomicrobiota bacterium]|jgi:uncharacterized membrane protein YraQ (UPF0718 family)